MLRRGIFLLSLFVFVAGNVSTVALATAGTLADHPKVGTLINKMVKKHKFDRKELTTLFGQVQEVPKVVERMTKPAEGLPWHRYRNIFLKDVRINQGVQFWQENEKALRRAEEKYGVPAEIIVAIIGVETRYGRHKGGYRILDSMATLMVGYPRRSKFFSRELEEFLLLARAEGFNPLEIEGSYAGAMGKPQFMPSSYRMYAVDFDGDGVRDLLNNATDAIGSVANYLSRHGWKRGQPITVQAEVTGSKRKLVKKGYKPHSTVASLEQMGVTSKQVVNQKLKSALIELEAKNGNEYWLSLPNFYAITRYNHSALYAMAVYQLAQSVSERRPKVASN